MIDIFTEKKRLNFIDRDENHAYLGIDESEYRLYLLKTGIAFALTIASATLTILISLNLFQQENSIQNTIRNQFRSISKGNILTQIQPK